MTIRLILPFNGIPANAIVSLDAATELALVNTQQATFSLAGGLTYNTNTPFGSTNPGQVLVSDGVAKNLTGTTSLTVLGSVLIPANAIGPNGSLRVSVIASCNNNANAKTLGVRLGTLSATASMASTTINQSQVRFTNRGNVASQVFASLSGGTLGTGTVDTSQSQVLAITGTLTNGGDNLQLESWLVELFPRS